MPITGEIRLPRINLEALEKELLKEMFTLLQDAAREFVRKSFGHIPVDTGMARSTLVPLGRFLNVLVRVAPKRRVLGKSPELGQLQSGFEFKIVKSVFSFEFNSKVFHHFLNDQFNIKRVPSSPWNSILIGSLAFTKFIAENLINALPSIKFFVRFNRMVI